jgi:hypothetical protein
MLEVVKMTNSKAAKPRFAPLHEVEYEKTHVHGYF